MRHARHACVLVVFSLWVYGAAGACASHIPEYALTDAGEGGVDALAEAPSEGALEEGADQEASTPPPVPMTHVRFAVWSPDTPEADFCVAPAPSPADAGEAGSPDDGGDGDAAAGSEADAGPPVWQGPIVAQAVSEIEGGTSVFADADMPGVSFPEVTRYFELPAGGYLFRPVAAGASDCSLPLLPSDAPLPDLQVNAFTTVALVGDYAQAASDALVTIDAFTDDTSAASGKIALRFVAALSRVTLLDLGTGMLGSPGFRPLFVDVPFGEIVKMTETDAGKVDDHGYLSIPPLKDTTLTATIANVSDAGAPIVVTGGVSIASGSVATLAAVGGKTGGPSSLLLCLDTAHAIGVVFADCHVLPSAGD